MDPASGKVHWEIPLKPNRMPINVPNPAVSEDGTELFLSTFYDGSRLIRLDPDALRAEIAWERQGVSERKTDALHCMISPPYINGDEIFGVDSYGQLRCLDKATGDRIWESLDATPEGRWSTIFMVRNGDKTWMLNELGELILARLTRDGFEEISRAKVIEPTSPLKQRRSGVVHWSPPAFAHGHLFVRNDRELVCVNLSAKP